MDLPPEDATGNRRALIAVADQVRFPGEREVSSQDLARNANTHGVMVLSTRFKVEKPSC